MHFEIRKRVLPGGRTTKELLIVCDSQKDSKAVDEAFGDRAGTDGLIATGTLEVRLSDGYCEHYLLLKRATP